MHREKPLLPCKSEPLELYDHGTVVKGGGWNEEERTGC